MAFHLKDISSGNPAGNGKLFRYLEVTPQMLVPWHIKIRMIVRSELSGDIRHSYLLTIVKFLTLICHLTSYNWCHRLSDS